MCVCVGSHVTARPAGGCWTSGQRISLVVILKWFTRATFCLLSVLKHRFEVIGNTTVCVWPKIVEGLNQLTLRSEGAFGSVKAGFVRCILKITRPIKSTHVQKASSQKDGHRLRAGCNDRMSLSSPVDGYGMFVFVLLLQLVHWLLSGCNENKDIEYVFEEDCQPCLLTSLTNSLPSKKTKPKPL